MRPADVPPEAGAVPINERPSAASFVTCPLCHTADAIVTDAALSAGGEWCCVSCSAQWDSARIARVAAYRAWVGAHRPSSLGVSDDGSLERTNPFRAGIIDGR